MAVQSTNQTKPKDSAISQRTIAAIIELPPIIQARFRTPRTPQQLPYRGTVS